MAEIDKEQELEEQFRQQEEEPEEDKGFNLAQYLQEVRGEIGKVTWPTQGDAFSLTRAVLLVTVVVTSLLYIFDYLVSTGLKSLIDLWLNNN